MKLPKWSSLDNQAKATVVVLSLISLALLISIALPHLLERLLATAIVLAIAYEIQIHRASLLSLFKPRPPKTPPPAPPKT